MDLIQTNAGATYVPGVEEVNTINEEIITKEGYAYNFNIEGKSIVSFSPIGLVDTYNADGVTRTRLVSPLDNSYLRNSRISKGIFTFYNFTDKLIRFITVNRQNDWGTGISVSAKSSKVVTLTENEAVVGVDFRPVDGWSNADPSIYVKEMFMIVEGRFEGLPYLNAPISHIGGREEGLTLSVVQPLSVPYTLGGSVYVPGRYLETNSPTNAMTLESSMCVLEGDKKVNPNTTYVFENSNKNIVQNDINHNDIYYDNNVIKQAEYIQSNISARHSGISVLRTTPHTEFLTISLEASLKDKYKYYEANVDTIKLPRKLRGISTGSLLVQDTIVNINGEPHIKQMVNEKVISGNLDIYGVTKGTNTTCFGIRGFLTDAMSFGGADSINLVCDTFAPRFLANVDDIEGIHWGGDNNLYIRVLNSRLATFDVAGAKTLINNLAPRLIYPLAKPIYHKLDFPKLKLFGGKQKFIVDSMIPTKITFNTTHTKELDFEMLKDRVDYLEKGDKRFLRMDGVSIDCDNGTLKFKFDK